MRRFEWGRDEQEWLRVNAAAFAEHPEQGALTMPDLEQRMAQAWFDPEGFILVVPSQEPDRIAAFHWTKVDPPHGPTGEVYVVGVAPDRQGLGLGKAVTILGQRCGSSALDQGWPWRPTPASSSCAEVCPSEGSVNRSTPTGRA